MPSPIAPTDFSPSQLAAFLRSHRGAILERWRVAVQDRPVAQDLPLEDLIDHIPDLLEAIADTGESYVHDNRSRLDTEMAERHALERLSEGLDLSQVVIELAVLRDCILQVWDQERAPGAARPEVRFLNRSVDRAIAASVDRYTLARERTLKALDRISAAALEARRLEDLLQRLLEVIVETTASVDVGGILLREGDWLVMRAAVGFGAAQPSGSSVAIGEGFVGRVGAEARPRLASAADLEAERIEPFPSARPLSCAYAVPLLNEGTLVGVALIGSFRAPDFSDQDRRLLQATAARATSGIVQHLLQETAQTRAAELAAVIEAIPDAVLVGDADGIRHANSAALSILEMRSVEEINRSVRELPGALRIRRSDGSPMPPEYRPFGRALRGETVSDELLVRMPRSGREIVMRTAAAPVRLGERIAGAVIVGTDVTAEKRAIEDRQRLLERAEQAVADRDHVLAVVSHELRNPLNTVTMAAGVLRDIVSVPEAGQKSIATLVRSAERMKRMIQDLLDLSSIQAGRLAIDPRPLDAKQLAEEAVETFGSEASDKGLTLALELEGDLPMIRADRDRLLQALANLVSNASKATSRGGILVGARWDVPSQSVVFWVRDTGPGISEEQKNRLFEPYWRGQTTYRGTGLGLAITRGIVDAHGGRIWLESTPGAGATFFFTIPRA
jgi:signal transduction histidine kinase